MDELTKAIQIFFLAGVAVLAFSYLMSLTEPKGTPEIDKASNYFYGLAMVPFAIAILLMFAKLMVFLFT